MRLFLVALLESLPASDLLHLHARETDRKKLQADTLLGSGAMATVLRNYDFSPKGLLGCVGMHRRGHRLGHSRMDLFPYTWNWLHEMVHLTVLRLRHQQQASMGVVRHRDSCELPSQCMARSLPQVSSPRLTAALGEMVFLFHPGVFTAACPVNTPGFPFLGCFNAHSTALCSYSTCP